jgi:hypothetical protein
MVVSKTVLDDLCRDGVRGFNQQLRDLLETNKDAVAHAIQCIQDGWETNHLNPEMIAAALLGEADSWEAEIRFEATRGRKADTVPQAVSDYRKIAFTILAVHGHLAMYAIKQTDVSPLTEAEQAQLSEQSRRLLKTPA